MSGSFRIERLGRERFEAAVDVLTEAFFDYPVMRYVVGPAEDYPRRLRRLIRFFTVARVLKDDLVHGVCDASGEVVAVANINLPGKRPSPPALDAEREALWADLGTAARLRYEAFGEATAGFEISEPHYHLGMIGVRRSGAGEGHGRRLLDHLHAMSAGDEGSAGVSLTTEDPKNVGLYKHFGYRIVGHERVSTFETWGFFRADVAG